MGKIEEEWQPIENKLRAVLQDSSDEDMPPSPTEDLIGEEEDADRFVLKIVQ